MNYKNVLFSALCVAVGGVSYGAGFLKAQSFPKTFQDLPFQTRMEILADGYEVWESEYDSNGRCISGCAYHGITIEEAEELSRAATEELKQLVEQEEQAQQDDKKHQEQDDKDEPVAPSSSPWGQNFFGPPLAGDLVVTSDFGTTKKGDGSYRQHNGIDLRADEGTPVYAAADGIVEKVAYDKENGGGCYVLIEHNFTISGKQIYTSYAHLGGCDDANETYTSPTVYVGKNVHKGEQIGISGNSGSSSAAHLHYKIRDTAGTSIDPLGFGQNVNYLGANYRFKPTAVSGSRRMEQVGCTCADTGLEILKSKFLGCQGCSSW